MEQRRGLAVRRDTQLNVERHTTQLNAKLGAARVSKTATTVALKEEAKENVKPVEIERCKDNVVYGGVECLVTANEAAEIDTYLKHVQQSRKLDANFLKEAAVDSRMRAILLDWVAQIQSKFRLSAETFYLACALIDRVVKPLKVSRQNFQLIGLACIYVASKYEEVLLPNVHDFVYMGGDICNIETLFKAEKNILRTVRFRLSFTYPNHFLRKLRFYMPSDHTMLYEMSKLLVDVAVIDYKTCWWLPSEMAAAATHLTYMVHRRPTPTDLIETIGVSAARAATLARTLAARAPSYIERDGKLQGLRMKYKGCASLDTITSALPYLKSLV